MTSPVLTPAKQNIPMKALLGLHALALGGVALSILLTQHFYAVRGGTAGFKSFCTLNATVNCDIVAASPWAELAFGLPLSSFSAGWMLALFLVSLLIHLPQWSRAATKTCLGLTVLGCLIGLPYALIMILKIKAYCLMCLGVDAVSLGTFLCALGLLAQEKSPLPQTPQISTRLYMILGGITALMVVLTVGLLKTFESPSFPAADLDSAAQSILQSPAISVHTDDRFPSIGPKTAPITIVEFSDFQCPFCQIAALALHSVTQHYPKQIRIIFRNFPLDQQCNRSMQQSMHPFGCEAARIAHCAHQQGKFESVYEALFEGQNHFSEGQLIPIATAQGIDPQALQSCMSHADTASAIARDVEEAITLEIKSTPTFFVNGHKLEGAIPVAVWNRIIDHLLTTK